MRKLTIFGVCFLLAGVCHARIITVDDDGPADFNSIQTAIDSASNEDIIIVQPGLYDEDIYFLGKNITLTSTNPTNPNVVAATIIGDDANETTITFSGTEDETCTFSGFNINGYIEGWDQFAEPPSPNPTHATISYCLLQGNCGACGTVILSCDGLISNCIIANNTSTACPHNCAQVALPTVFCHGLIKNCTILGYIGIGESGLTTIQNCIIDGPIEIFGNATVNILYSNIHRGPDTVLLNWPYDGVVNWGPGNIDTDPCFARLGYWDFNEPATFFEGDYHLQSSAGRWDPNQNQWVIDVNTSDCIDAGNPGCPTGSEPPYNGNRINMGAYAGTATAGKSPADWRNIADLTNDWVVDVNDLAVFADYWLDSGDCIPSDLNHNCSVEFNDFAIWAGHWLWEQEY